MKWSVALLLVLSTFSSGAVSQTPSRRSNQGADSKPRSDVIRICQGVPIPDGYVIVAYMTSSACPHGGYLLKKQADYENSLAINGSAKQPGDASPTAAGKTPTQQVGSPTQKSSGQPTRKTASPAGALNGPSTSRSQASNTGIATGTTSATSRPRRVGTQMQDSTQSPDATSSLSGPPVLIGGGAAPGPSRPPALMGPEGVTDTTTTDTSVDASKPVGPEEVSDGDVIRVDTALVTVPVSVLDRQGRFVPNLKREDFTVFENGVQQEIANFEPAEKPFTVALMLDTSPSTHFHLNEIKAAAIEFAKRLRPQDRVLIVSFSDEVLVLTEVTNDMNTIETVVEENAFTGSSTRLYDAVDLTINERLNKIRGRKAIVLFTDGVDTSSEQATYQSTLSEVEELDALIYPIQYDTTDYLRAMQNAGSGVTVVTTRQGLFGTTTSRQTYTDPLNGGLPVPGSSKEDYDRADHYLHSLADKTGGRLYEANTTDQLSQAFARIAEELRRQYTIGYYPKTEGDTGGRRQIKVKVRQPNMAVKARDSYTKPLQSPSK